MEIRKHLHIVRRQKKVDWTQFLCGIPARDYIFLKELYEEQITQASAYLKEADHVLIGAGAGLSALPISFLQRPVLPTAGNVFRKISAIL